MSSTLESWIGEMLRVGVSWLCCTLTLYFVFGWRPKR